MRKIYFGLLSLGGLGLLVSLGASWWLVTLDTGAVLAVTGLAASPSASSLLAAAGASFALGLVLRGVWRRVVALFSAALTVGAIVVWLGVLAEPQLAVRGDITAVTGLSGDSALMAIANTSATGFLWVGLGAAAVAVVAALVGVVMRDAPPRASRYQRHRGEDESGDAVVVWDRLSSGDDPTHR